MPQLRVEPLSRKFSIVKDHLWCVYDGDQPLFHGTASQCRDWLDRHEAFPLDEDHLPEVTTSPRLSLWSRLCRLTFKGQEN